MIDQLRQLIRRFVVDGMAYVDFRQEVVRFQSAADSDMFIEKLYNVIESASSAFDHGYIDISVLKSELLVAAQIQVENAAIYMKAWKDADLDAIQE